MKKEYLIGKDDSAMLEIESSGILLHTQVVDPFLKLKDKVKEQFGIELGIISGYRSFDRQAHIWDSKVRGDRPILNDRGETIQPHVLNDSELLFAILRYSALPGASRHHWGTDLDVFDATAMKKKDVQLVPSEWQENGPCFRLGQCLDELIKNDDSFGFFRPYEQDKNGVAPEMWHLSYAPLSQKFMQELDIDTFRKLISAQEFELKETALSHLEEIYQRFVLI